MPEVHVRLRWPDGSRQDVYSPSLVVTDRLAVQDYPVPELVSTLTSALEEASDRVQASYGFPCSRAAASIKDVTSRARAFSPDEVTAVEAFLR